MIPDPIELMNSRINDLIFEWESNQKGVSEGFYKCPYCKDLFNYEPIQVSSRPDSTVCCYECLDETTKKMYDQFFKE